VVRVENGTRTHLCCAEQRCCDAIQATAVVQGTRGQPWGAQTGTQGRKRKALGWGGVHSTQQREGAREAECPHARTESAPSKHREEAYRKGKG
jgi:hypothetical protein